MAGLRSFENPPKDGSEASDELEEARKSFEAKYLRKVEIQGYKTGLRAHQLAEREEQSSIAR